MNKSMEDLFEDKEFHKMGREGTKVTDVTQ